MLDLRRAETLEKLAFIMLDPAFVGEENALAAYELGSLKAYESIQALVQALEVEDTVLRVAALDSLGYLGIQGIVPDILPFFKRRDLSLHVRHVGLLTLGELPHPDALTVLVPALVSSEEPWLKWSAAIALGGFDETFTHYLYPQLLEALLEAHQAQATAFNPFRSLAELAFQRLVSYESFQQYIHSIVFSATRNAIQRLVDTPRHPLAHGRLRYEREPITEPTLDIIRRQAAQPDLPERFAGLAPQKLGWLLLN
jgi:HEAT repeat protein